MWGAGKVDPPALTEKEAKYSCSDDGPVQLGASTGDGNSPSVSRTVDDQEMTWTPFMEERDVITDIHGILEMAARSRSRRKRRPGGLCCSNLSC